MAHHELNKEELDYRLNSILKQEDFGIPTSEPLINPPNLAFQGIKVETSSPGIIAPQIEPKPEPLSPGSENRKKRGRKPIRPNDPIKKKTEEKDKFWLRSFRSYISNNYPHFKTKLTAEENSF
mmetsp:Transcript_30186/g.29863  ORF Transcript_30186/g.29863 Transcript_30186/m.29863 type:complete len:123 (+) Transcript_30186:39-407(+)